MLQGSESTYRPYLPQGRCHVRHLLVRQDPTVMTTYDDRVDEAWLWVQWGHACLGASDHWIWPEEFVTSLEVGA
jgi:hypothetical protein